MFPNAQSIVLTLTILVLSASFQPSLADKGPNVVVTIQPIHSLISGLMKGVGAPKLLIEGTTSPHQFSLKPSQARALHQADLIIWVSRNLETSLMKPIGQMKKPNGVLEISKIAGVKLLEDDPHLWLHIGNAKTMLAESMRRLIAIDPANEQIYIINREHMTARLSRLDQEIAVELSPVKKIPFLVYHDAYQYIQLRYGLNFLGAVVTNADRRPGAKRIHQIRKMIKEAGVKCLFAEPQFNKSSLDTITKDTAVKLGELDPLGATLPQGPDAYFTLMKNLTRSISTCLR